LDIKKFEFDNCSIICPRIYYQFLSENFILDVYRSHEFLRENDLVLDLGASVGDFSVIASKKVGQKGKVIAIEPDAEIYEILRMNIRRNNCQNVIALNLGVGSEVGEKEITFWGRTYRFKVNTLENILHDLGINEKINFIKMDIEGFEADVVCKSIKTIKEANVISVEFHGTKQKLDDLLLPNGFFFMPITMKYIYKKLIKHLLRHPYNFYKAFLYTIKDKPQVLRSSITGYAMAKSDCLLIGSYIRDRW
jgi:FkbM family methyltransferase